MSDILPHISSPDEQFTLGLNLLQKAFAAKHTQYNSELNQMRNYVKQKTDENNELRVQMNEMRREMKDKDEKMRMVEDSLIKFRSEKDGLLEQIKRLNREVSKLTQFKKAIIASINEEELNDNIGSYAAVQSTLNRLNSTLSSTRSSVNNSPSSTHSSLLSSPSKSYVATGTPGLSTSGSSSSGVTGSTGTQYNSYQIIEGKAFFKKAKIELPHESFNSFLSCIKKFNAKQMSKEETLKAVRNIFREEHEDLYQSFEMILDKHGDSFRD